MNTVGLVCKVTIFCPNCNCKSQLKDSKAVVVQVEKEDTIDDKLYDLNLRLV